MSLLDFSPHPRSIPADHDDLRHPSPEKRITRRDFLFLSLSLSLLGISPKIIRVLGANPDLLDAVLHSVRSGKAPEDIREIIASRLGIGSGSVEVISHSAENSYPPETWMYAVAESVNIIDLQRGEKHGPMAVFEVTHSSQVTRAPRKEGRVGGSSLTTVCHDLTSVLQLQPSLTLPAPQFRVPTQRAGEVSRYLQYNMFAWAEGGDQETDSALPYSGVRGGVVLTKEGVFAVVSPEEFADQHQRGVHACQEFAFVIDSEDLEGSYQTLKTASEGLLKDVLRSAEFANFLVTFHFDSGELRTYLLAGYNPKPDETQNTSDDLVMTLNPLQMGEVATQMAKAMGAQRFVIGITDPSPQAANCYAPLTYSETFGTELRSQERPQWMDELGLPRTQYRVIGSPYDDWGCPGESLPWVFSTSRDG